MPGVFCGGDSDFLVLEFDVDRTSVDHRKGGQDADDHVELHHRGLIVPSTRVVLYDIRTHFDYFR